MTLDTSTLGKSYSGSTTVYLTCAETAKLVRLALKKAFPGVKFSVRSDTYAGGASIHVSWTDGPLQDEVTKVTETFCGAGFDGMIDLKFSKQHWLHPDGTVSLARCEGTTGSRGYVEPQVGDPLGPTARLVRLGSDYVFATRRESEGLTAKARDEFERIFGEQPQDNKLYPVRWDEKYPALHVTGDEYGSTLLWRIVSEMKG